MDNEHIWIKNDDGDILYCEIKLISKDEYYGLVEYEVFPMIGCFNGCTTLITSDLNNPSICKIWTKDGHFGKACYDLDRLINDEE